VCRRAVAPVAFDELPELGVGSVDRGVWILRHLRDSSKAVSWRSSPEISLLAMRKRLPGESWGSAGSPSAALGAARSTAAAIRHPRQRTAPTAPSRCPDAKPRVTWIPKSGNKKLGPIPAAIVSTRDVSSVVWVLRQGMLRGVWASGHHWRTSSATGSCGVNSWSACVHSPRGNFGVTRSRATYQEKAKSSTQ